MVMMDINSSFLEMARCILNRGGQGLPLNQREINKLSFTNTLIFLPVIFKAGGNLGSL
jgi:hypothetical protein